MKNPFMESVDESLFLFIPGISDKQAEYAANAINQHEKLVAERDKLWELSTMQDELLACYRINRNPGGLLDRMKVVRAKLAKLKEETT